MNAKFYPNVLTGKTEAQAHNPLAMRYFALAVFAKGTTKIYLKNETEDFYSLKDALGDLGASVYRQNCIYTVTPPENLDYSYAEIDVKSSLSSLRTLLPMLSAKFDRLDFFGSGKLTRKDVTSGMNILKGVALSGKTLPLSTSGKLNNGEFIVEPDVNSQLVCSLIMALPMIEGDSVIRFSEKPKKQLAYLMKLTVGAMREFGVVVDKIDNGLKISGNQRYVAPQTELKVEGDYSTAGYFLSANLLGGSVVVENLSENSIQPDKEIIKLLKSVETDDTIELKGKTDYIFLLTGLASVKKRKTVFINVKIKDKDKEKFSDFILMLNKLGANVELTGETLTVEGRAKLIGGIMLDGLGDARVTMSLIMLSCAVENPVTILSVESAMTEQSSFLNEFIRLGGKCETV